MKMENEITNGWSNDESKDITDVVEILRNHDVNVQEYIADFVASLCGVYKDDMMRRTDKIHISHARWLFWFAYRYMTNEPYAKIAEITERYGRKFTEQGISNSVNKMSMMITSQPTWTKKWLTIKRIIKQKEKDEHNDLVVTIYVPREIKNEIRFEIKEK